jgi:hypothetical protein
VPSFNPAISDKRKVRLQMRQKRNRKQKEDNTDSQIQSDCEFVSLGRAEGSSALSREDDGVRWKPSDKEGARWGIVLRARRPRKNAQLRADGGSERVEETQTCVQLKSWGWTECYATRWKT